MMHLTNSTMLAASNEILSLYHSLSLKFCILLGILTAAMVVGVCGNFIVCWIVFRKAAMRSAINLLLAHLALSDISVCMLSIPVYLFYLIKHRLPLGDTFCEIIGFTQTFFVSTGCCILLTISLDRYFIIVYRKDKLDPNRVKLFILSSWICACLIACCPLFGWGSYALLPTSTNVSQTSRSTFTVFGCIMVIFLPVIIMTYCYVCIICSVRRNGLKVHHYCKDVPYHNNRIVKSSSTWIRPLVTVDVSFKTRSFKTIFILFLLLVVCWVPFCVAVFARAFYCYANSEQVIFVLLCLGFSKSVLNPIVYLIRIKQLRTACKKALPVKVNKICNLFNIITQRRINPSAAYQCSDWPTNTVKQVTTVCEGQELNTGMGGVMSYAVFCVARDYSL